MSPFFIPYAITNMGSALVAIDQGFMGPNYSISTACATANYAFHASCQHIRNGEADMMIAGGSEAAIIPVGLGGFVACRCEFFVLPVFFVQAQGLPGCVHRDCARAAQHTSFPSRERHPCVGHTRRAAVGAADPRAAHLPPSPLSLSPCLARQPARSPLTHAGR